MIYTISPSIIYTPNNTKSEQFPTPFLIVVGKKETIYPLVQTVNALYLQLLEMQKAFIGATVVTNTLTNPSTDNVTSVKSDSIPSSADIKELQAEYTNMLTAIIDLLDGAKYLWEGDRHGK